MKSLLNPVTLRIEGIGNIPSFKNSKSIFKRKEGTPFIATNPKLKERMGRLENAILFALYSLCQTEDDVMDGACRKRVQTLLSGLSDDSLKEMPQGSFDVEYVEKGKEGVIIEITKL